MLMKGIVPPRPMNAGGLPKKSRDACSSDRASHGASSGSIPAGRAPVRFESDLRPYGGSASIRLLSFSLADFGSQPGGIRSDSLSAVSGRSTLPALPIAGIPSTPMIDSAGRQSRFRINSVRFGRHRTHTAGEGKVGDYRIAQRRRRHAGLPHPRLRNRSVKLLRNYATRLLILDPADQLARDPKAVRDHSARSRMDPLRQHLDRECAADQSTQRRRTPKLVVSTAPRVQSDHQAGLAEAIAQMLDIVRQVEAAALLARLDQHDAARVRYRLVHKALIAARLANIA